MNNAYDQHDGDVMVAEEQPIRRASIRTALWRKIQISEVLDRAVDIPLTRNVSAFRPANVDEAKTGADGLADPSQSSIVRLLGDEFAFWRASGVQQSTTPWEDSELGMTPVDESADFSDPIFEPLDMQGSPVKSMEANFSFWHCARA